MPICSTVAGMCTAAAGGRPLSTSIWPCYHACLVAQAAALMARHKRGRHECSDLLLPQQSGDIGSAAGSVIALKLDTNVQAVLICVILTGARAQHGKRLLASDVLHASLLHTGIQQAFQLRLLLCCCLVQGDMCGKTLLEPCCLGMPLHALESSRHGVLVCHTTHYTDFTV